MKISKLRIQGKKQDNLLQSSSSIIELRESFVIEPVTRGLDEVHDIDLKDNDLIELTFEDNTVWFSSPHTLDEIFPELTQSNRGVNEGMIVPLFLSVDEKERGIKETVALKGLKIFAKKTVGTNIKELAGKLERKQLDDHVGLFGLDANFQFTNFDKTKTGGEYLLFLHGTASSTHGSFSDLLTTPTWKYINQTYGANVLAFQHESLTKSPLENVADLVRQLPANATFDMISQSRGGLVGEVLARFCTGDENNSGFSSDELELLKKEYSPAFYNDCIQQITDIKTQLQLKKIKIRRFIRSACPASGTTLASQRLDNFLNITFNLIGFGTGWGSNPIYMLFKELIAAVVDCKNQEEVLPGLECMNPTSVFIKLLNSPSSMVIDNSLTIIAGNAKASFSLKGLLVIATKLFFRHKNDFIVNTESMYLGTKRSGMVQFFYDEGTAVNHFSYFKNERTYTALGNALKTAPGVAITDFLPVSMAANDAYRNAVLGLDGGQVFQNAVSGTKPIVVLLPGIMGSNLSVKDNLVWINYIKMFGGRLKDLDISNSSNIKAMSIIKTSYKKLIDHLNPNYDVVTYAFDWRLQLNTVALDLEKKLKELMAHGQPIKLIGHSMGGVLVRDFIVTCPDTWKTLNATAGFKLMFLGSPLGGSYRIPAVLFGQDDIINKLSMIDIRHTKAELIDIFAKFPGILSLLPLTQEADHDFADAKTWNYIATAKDKWPLPGKQDLADFGKYRAGILSAQESMDYSNAVYIAGKDKSTPCGYRIDDTPRGKELVILCTAEGDQSVTWESGIPKKMIENNSVYYVNATHGGLANTPAIFAAMDELLEKGTTNLISRSRPSVRGEEKVFRQTDQFDFDLSPKGIENTLLSMGSEQETVSESRPLQVSVSLGDLRYAAFPLLAGHFNRDGIIYAEKSIDECLNGVLSQRHMLNLYPGDIGTNTFVSTSSDEFKGAIIVGLGEPGELTAYNLSKTVGQGVTKYLIDLNSTVIPGNPMDPEAGKVGISSLIIGSSYGGLSYEESIHAILSGIQSANHKINGLFEGEVRTIEYVELIELYEDKALACMYAISNIEKEDSEIHISTNEIKVKKLLGSKKRLPITYSGNWWDRITVQNANGDPNSNVLRFSITTGGARQELTELKINREIIESLLQEVSEQGQWTPETAKIIFELLIPNNFKLQVKNQNNINWIIDEGTASFPWELLQDSVSNSKPLCINAGMIRQLNTANYSVRINMAASNNALVVGDPDLKGFKEYSQLAGAQKEGALVSGLFANAGLSTTVKINSTATDIIRSLFNKDYKIIHLAGHGVYNRDKSKATGMVIGNNVYLTTEEISQLPSVPEFVFVNCCHLGKTEAQGISDLNVNYRLAANIGTELIGNGVKAVVAAGWAVDDAAAFDFTRKFYECMFKGETFGEAVLKARQEIFYKYENRNNTWGAYQCYGDPFYKFDASSVSHNPGLEYLMSEEAEIDLNNLHNEMETNRYSAKGYLEKMQVIYTAVEKAGIRNAAITEKEALIYADLGEYDFAILKFKELFKNERASFATSTIQKYYNTKSKKAVADFRSGKAKAADLMTEINESIAGLESLLMLGNVSELNSLLASTYKRKAILSTVKTQKEKAYKEAANYYMKAHNIQGNLYTAYCLTNWFELETLFPPDHGWKEEIFFANSIHAIRSNKDATHLLNTLKTKMLAEADNTDFWHITAIANVKLCLLIIGNSKDPADWLDVLNTFKKVWQRAGSKGKRLSEMEHLDFLIDAMVLSKNQHAPKLKKNIEQLKAELEKLI
jgi:CHAT domain-containing protein/pimeloyl-ACP methyl ester carboxylesterase